MPIDKGSLRLVSTVFVRPGRSTKRLRCLGCAFRPEIASTLEGSVLKALRAAVAKESYGFPPYK